MSERNYQKLLEDFINATQSDRGVQITEKESVLLIEKLVESANALQQQNQHLQKENIELKGTLSAIGQMCGEITKFVNESLEGKANE